MEKTVIYNDGKFKVERREKPNGGIRVCILRRSETLVTNNRTGNLDVRHGWELVLTFDDIKQARGVGDAMLCAGEPVERECKGYGKEEVEECKT